MQDRVQELYTLFLEKRLSMAWASRLVPGTHMSLPPQDWGYMHVSPCPGFPSRVLGLEPESSRLCRWHLTS